MTSIATLTDPHLLTHPPSYRMNIVPFSYEKLSLTDVLLDLGVRFILNCPKQDISTPSRLMFQVEEAHWFYEDFAREQNLGLPAMSLQSFTRELYRIFPVLSSLCEDYQKAYSEFKEYKKGIPVRGVIVLNDKLNKVLMVRPWKRPHWGFPRGKINKEEDDRVCAVREVVEETGFDTSDYLDPKFYCERTITGKNFRFYFASGVPESTIFATRTRKEIDEIKWIPLSELKNKNSRRKFFLITMFMSSIDKFIRQKKGYATKLSQTESDALKHLLGVSGTPNESVHNDEESAQQLLSMLKSQPEQPSVPVNPATPSLPPTPSPISSAGSSVPPELPPAAVSQPQSAQSILTPASPTNTDRQVLLNLLKESTPNAPGSSATPGSTEVESAKQILALLKKEIDTERIVASPKSHQLDAVVSPQVPVAPAPVLPPNSMLEQLVSSRKNNPARRPSVAPKEKPKLSRNRLLDVLKSPGSHETKLIDLLVPPQPELHDQSSSSASFGTNYMQSKNPLMDLLETEDRGDGPDSTSSSVSLERTSLNEGSEQDNIKKTEETNPDNISGNALLSLLESQQKPSQSFAPPTKIEDTAVDSGNNHEKHLEVASDPQKDEVASNSLFSLLNANPNRQDASVTSPKTESDGSNKKGSKHNSLRLNDATSLKTLPTGTLKQPSRETTPMGDISAGDTLLSLLNPLASEDSAIVKKNEPKRNWSPKDSKDKKSKDSKETKSSSNRTTPTEQKQVSKPASKASSPGLKNGRNNNRQKDSKSSASNDKESRSVKPQTKTPKNVPKQAKDHSSLPDSSLTNQSEVNADDRKPSVNQNLMNGPSSFAGPVVDNPLLNLLTESSRPTQSAPSNAMAHESKPNEEKKPATRTPEVSLLSLLGPSSQS